MRGSPSPRATLALALGLLACAAREPALHTGPDAIITVDGLYKVEPVELGSLFMKPDYQFGSYERFYLGHTELTFQRGSRVLPVRDVEEVKARFDAVAREAIKRTGRQEVTEPGSCVAHVTLSLFDLELLDPKEMSGARTTVVSSFGAATLVMDIRDGHTGEPLLRYGRRRPLEGGLATGADPAKGRALSLAFERFASDFTRDFERSLPRVKPPEPVLTCQQRAAKGEWLPPVGAGKE